VNAPSFLPNFLSTLMLVLAVYALWRLAIAPAWGRRTDIEADVLQLAAGLAAAGLLSTWARTLPRHVWAGLFAAGAVYFAARAGQAWSDVQRRRPLLARAGVCAVLVYMFLAGVAPSTLHGSTAGQYTMAGMPGMIVDQTVDLPALGLILVAGLAFYAVAVLARVGAETEQAGVNVSAGVRADTGADAMDGEDAEDALSPGGRGTLLAPRSVEACQVALALVLAYAILSKIV
jgi:hypothetical protein